MRRTSRRLPRRVLGAVSGAAVVAALAAAPASAAPSGPLAPVQDFLAGRLAGLTGSTTVLVHGVDAEAARAAVAATGMRTVTEFERIGVVVATGTAGQIGSARSQPGVTYLEGNAPIEFAQETSNLATRGAEAVSTLTGVNGERLDGSGVSAGRRPGRRRRGGRPPRRELTRSAQKWPCLPGRRFHVEHRVTSV